MELKLPTGQQCLVTIIGTTVMDGFLWLPTPMVLEHAEHRCHVRGRRASSAHRRQPPRSATWGDENRCDIHKLLFYGALDRASSPWTCWHEACAYEFYLSHLIQGLQEMCRSIVSVLLGMLEFPLNDLKDSPGIPRFVTMILQQKGSEKLNNTSSCLPSNPCTQSYPRRGWIITLLELWPNLLSVESRVTWFEPVDL